MYSKLDVFGIITLTYMYIIAARTKCSIVNQNESIRFHRLGRVANNDLTKVLITGQFMFTKTKLLF